MDKDDLYREVLVEANRSVYESVYTTEDYQAGSLRAIFYVFCQLIDEILHAIPLVNDTEWAFRFCQWAHRHDDVGH